MNMVLIVAVGGAIGASARFLVGSVVGGGSGWPWGTFVVNVLGSFVFGVLIESWALAWSPSQEVRAFLTVGLLGGFTTFSAFSMDVVLLAERGRLDLALLYAATTVVLSVTALFCGLRAAQPPQEFSG